MVDVVDVIINSLREGDKLPMALRRVYVKRNVVVPYSERMLDVDIAELNLHPKVANILYRARLNTIGKVIDFADDVGITEIKALGKRSSIYLFEKILNYCWEHMNCKEQAEFLIDTVERNQNNLRPEFKNEEVAV